jgi:hypothetical protein
MSIFSGRGEYYLDVAMTRIAIASGDAVVAPVAQAKAGFASRVRQNLLFRIWEVAYITSTASTSTEETVSSTS